MDPFGKKKNDFEKFGTHVNIRPYSGHLLILLRNK